MYLSRLKIQEAMCSKGLKTFTELADLVGITKNQLSLMLSENYNPLKSKVMDLSFCKPKYSFVSSTESLSTI